MNRPSLPRRKHPTVRRSDGKRLMIAGTPPKPIAPVGRLPFAFAKRHGVLVRGVVDGKAQIVYREGAQPSVRG